MNKEDYKKHILICNKFINRYIFQSRKFIEYACFQYGKFNEIITQKPDLRYIWDYQYFVFTKSTKTLISIRSLLKQGNMEDVLILLRTMFEGYLASRFIDEEYNQKLLNDFLFIPQLISHRKVIYQNNEAMDRDSKTLLEFIQRNPSQLKLGKDKAYFTYFYDYLCDYAHCNYSILECYLNEHDLFSCSEKTNDYLVRILVLFVFTKTFESIVTVDGEDFQDKRTEQECYKLVTDVTIFLYKQLGYLSQYSSNVNDELNNHMKKMFKNMKKSLEEEIGSIKKDFLI